MIGGSTVEVELRSEERAKHVTERTQYTMGNSTTYAIRSLAIPTLSSSHIERPPFHKTSCCIVSIVSFLCNRCKISMGPNMSA